MKIRAANVNGKAGWVVDIGVRDGRRRRKYFLDRKEAEKALTQAEKVAREVGRAWVDLPPGKRADVVFILNEVEARGLTLRQVWDGYRSGTQANVTEMTLGQSIMELIKAKAGANRRKVYLASLEQYLNRFAAGREAKPLGSVTVEEVEAFVNASGSVWSRATTLNRLSTLFSQGVQRGWCAFNPCDRIDRPRIDMGVPEILTVKEARQALEFSYDSMPDFIPWLALALFAGIRPEEIDRMNWDNVDLKRAMVTLDALGTKVRARRIVHLKPVAVDWLKLGGRLPLPRMTRIRCLRRLRELFGWKAWKKDCLRHTCASCWLASDPDAGRVAMELGNSVGVLHRHYKELISAEVAKEFWALSPEKCTKKQENDRFPGPN